MTTATPPHHERVTPRAARDRASDVKVGLVIATSIRVPGSVAHEDARIHGWGVPVVPSGFALRSIIEKHDFGLLVDGKALDAIAATIGSYAADTELLDRHGANGRRAAVHARNWAQEEAMLVAAFDKVVKN